MGNNFHNRKDADLDPKQQGVHDLQPWDNTKDDVLMMAIHSRFMNSDKKIIISGLKIVGRRYTSNATLIIIDLENGKTEELK